MDKPPSPMPPERIMLVDDSEADNVFHEIMLRAGGFAGDLRVFDQPLRALDYLRSLPDGPVGLVLLDINMPVMSGFEFAAAAAPLVAAHTSMLVMLTTSPLAEDIERAAALPAVNGYLTKPLDVAKVRDLLAGRWPRLEPPGAAASKP